MMRQSGRIYIFIIACILLLLLPVSIYGECDLGKIVPSNPASWGSFGATANDAAFDGIRALVGDYEAAGKTTDSGAAYVFRLTNATWTQEGRLIGSDSANYDYFGWAIEIDCNFAAVGAYRHNGSRGAVYVFRYDNAAQQWQQHQKIAPALDIGDGFGFSVAICGNLLAVGTPGDDDVGTNYGGAVYVYRLDTDTGLWNYDAKLLVTDGGNVDWTGWDVDTDGTIVVAGAPRKSSYRGAVYIFSHNGITWQQKQKLVSSDIAIEDFFGQNISLNGNLLLVGASGNDDLGDSSGSAYLFRQDAITHLWSQQAKLLPNDGAANDYFGCDVALSAKIAVIGASGDDDGATDAGSTYIFAPPGDPAVWQQVAKLGVSLPHTGDKFGSSVAAKGWVAIVTAPGDDDAKKDAGAAYATAGFSQNDCNGNGVPDECDIANGVSKDENSNGIPDECEMPVLPADLDGDEDVDASDLAVLGAYWHRDDCSGASECAVADVTGDGKVYADDLAVLCASWLAGAE